MRRKISMPISALRADVGFDKAYSAKTPSRSCLFVTVYEHPPAFFKSRVLFFELFLMKGYFK